MNKITILVLSVITLLWSGCIKKDFDIPPVKELPVGTIYTIQELRAMYADSGAYVFDHDASVYATVTTDEASGNFYREAYVQDLADAVNLRLDNPGGLRLGDSIRIYLKGIMLNEYNDLFQLDQVSNDSNIVILANKQYFEPEVVNIDQLLTGAYQSRLIQLENVQFSDLDLGLTWAPADDYGNRTLEDCQGNTVIVRTSNYTPELHLLPRVLHTRPVGPGWPHPSQGRAIARPARALCDHSGVEVPLHGRTYTNHGYSSHRGNRYGYRPIR
ncbi:MAG: DUF5689 domain-containing protein [bacterium]